MNARAVSISQALCAGWVWLGSQAMRSMGPTLIASEHQSAYQRVLTWAVGSVSVDRNRAFCLCPCVLFMSEVGTRDLSALLPVFARLCKYEGLQESEHRCTEKGCFRGGSKHICTLRAVGGFGWCCWDRLVTRGICDGFAAALFGLLLQCVLLSGALQRFRPSSFSQTCHKTLGVGSVFGAVPRVRRRDDLKRFLTVWRLEAAVVGVMSCNELISLQQIVIRWEVGTQSSGPARPSTHPGGHGS